MPLVQITKPEAEPVTLAEAKRQIGLSPVEDTDQVKERELALLLRRYIRTAREECESRTRRVFITQTWQLRLNGWPGERSREGYPIIRLPKPPFQQLLSFVYTDVAGNLQNIIPPVLAVTGTQPGADNPLNYTAPPWTCQIEPGSETQPAYVAPPYAQPWPPIILIPANVVLTFECGYGDTGDCVPAKITQAILALVHSYYDPGAFKDVDKLVDGLLSHYVNHIV